jgi:hypothetical protein
VRLLRKTKLMLGDLKLVSRLQLTAVSFGMLRLHSLGINEQLTPMVGCKFGSQ